MVGSCLGIGAGPTREEKNCLQWPEGLGGGGEGWRGGGKMIDNGIGRGSAPSQAERH